VTALAVTPLVEISTNNIDFKRVVISQGSNQPGKAEVILNNNTEKDINFRIEYSPGLNPKTFELKNTGTI